MVFTLPILIQFIAILEILKLSFFMGRIFLIGVMSKMMHIVLINTETGNSIWNTKTALIFGNCVITGLLTGMLGVGGGLLLFLHCENSLI